MPPDPKPQGVVDEADRDEDLDVADDQGEADDDALAAAAGEDDELGDADDGDQGEGAPGRGRVLDGKRPPSRRNEDIREARSRAQEAEAKAAATAAEVAQLRAQLDAQARQQNDAAEAARLELMSPDERADYKIRKSGEAMQRQLMQTQFQLSDQSDKLAFDAMCRADPRARKLAGEVERRLSDLRSKGQNVKREDLLAFVIGRRALDNPQSQGKQQRQAERRREREDARGASPRGDARGERRRAGKTPAERLDGVRI